MRFCDRSFPAWGKGQGGPLRVIAMRGISAALIAVLLFEGVSFATDSKNVSYYGGTAPVFVTAKDPIEGTLDTTQPKELIFMAYDKPFKGEGFVIPYSSIIDLEYGQKTGRRIGLAATTTVLFGPIELLSLFSKKRKHFLTVGFKDEKTGEGHAAVFELGKDMVRTTLAIVQAKTGKQIEYQDEEAKKSAK